MAWEDPPDGFEIGNDSLVLWRYMDLPRFLDLILHKRLYFCRLGFLNDPFEASVSKHEHKFLVKAGANGDEAVRVRRKERRCGLLVNCWTREEQVESFALWRQYGAESEGVAVETTLGQLKQALEDSSDAPSLGIVSYRDFDTTLDAELLSKTDMGWAFRKRQAYEYEREYRIAMYRTDFLRANQCSEIPPGVYIDVNLSALVSRVIVGPSAKPFIVQSIRTLVSERLPSIKVEESKLSGTPIF